MMQPERLTIRPIDLPSDLVTLSRIWFDASLKAHPFIGEARLSEQRKLVEDQYFPNSEAWVPCEDGKPVAFISLLGTLIGAVFVKPNVQGKGIGRRLIAHALDLKRELALEVYTANEQAMAFYASLGFRELSHRDVDDQGLPFENAKMVLIAAPRE